jgi:peptide/nickel transport system substrate-binding protein
VEHLNPLLVQQGSVAHDLSQLIFSGLTRYDTKTGTIIGDLADFNVSEDGKQYTFTIRNKAKWHDGEPVTADDVIFTYNSVIKAPNFKGAILTYNDYTGIKVSKIDERTVQFLLEKPDSFFLVKTTVGLLPEHILRDEPIDLMDSSPFNFSPIGSGKYRYVSQVNLGNHIEYNLESFDEHHTIPSHIENILFKVFEKYENLENHLSELNAIRNVPKAEVERLSKKGDGMF